MTSLRTTGFYPGVLFLLLSSEKIASYPSYEGGAVAADLGHGRVST
jgi:hypothetical protein